ncbi:MAG: transposase, partial [Patescibacteria group bacterium]|nr:transposase [Patescibacteria group bacterium]
ERRKQELFEKLKKENNYLVKIICYCLMPNHYHLLLQQKSKEGISRFISQFQNSFTRYFNTKNKRKGHLFEGQFKAVRVETEEQLIHLSRYIHLNPFSSYVVKKIDDLYSYPYFSFKEYLDIEKGFCDKEVIFSYFKDKKKYEEFVVNQADYQRNLEKIKHMTFDNE